MITALVRYFLFLCLLLGGLNACADNQSAFQVSVQGNKVLVETNPSLAKNPRNAIVQAAKSGTEKGKSKRETSVFEFEEEKDDRISLARYSSRGKNFISLHFSHVPDFTPSTGKSGCPFQDHGHPITNQNHPYLLFQVFRI